MDRGESTRPAVALQKTRCEPTFAVQAKVESTVPIDDVMKMTLTTEKKAGPRYCNGDGGPEGESVRGRVDGGIVVGRTD